MLPRLLTASPGPCTPAAMKADVLSACACFVMSGMGGEEERSVVFEMDQQPCNPAAMKADVLCLLATEFSFSDQLQVVMKTNGLVCMHILPQRVEGGTGNEG